MSPIAEVGSAFVSVVPSAKGFGSKLDSEVGGELKTSGSKAGKVFGGALKLGALGALAGVAAAGAFLKGSIEEAREAQKVSALTASTIKATGGAAQVTTKQVADLAGALSLKTGIDDETIQSGQNMLLTFKNIRNEAGKGNDIFDQSTKTLVDMSAAMGTEPKQAAIQLGKALNDPVKGVSALSRVGVTFTEGQKKVIESLVKGGETAKAQKIVLGELNSEFGGAAAAQATAGEKAKVAFGNLQEAVGTALLPILDKALNLFTEFAIFLTTRGGPALFKIQGFFKSLGGSGGAGGLVTTLAGLGASIQANFLPVLQTMSNTFQTVILPAVLRLVGYLRANLLPIFAAVAGVVRDQVLPIIASMAQFLYGTLYPAVISIVTAVAARLKPVFDQLFKTIRTSVLPAIQQLLAKFHEIQPTLQKVILVVVKVIGFVLKLAASILAKVLPVVIRFAGFLIKFLVKAIGLVITSIQKVNGWIDGLAGAITRGVAKVRDFASTLQNLAQRGLNVVLNAISQLPGKIVALGGKFLDAGKSIIGKFVDGLKNAGGVVSGIAGNVWDALKGLINSAINQINAALDFTIDTPGPGSIHIDAPNIPTLAAGGIISRPTMALVGEGGESEAVMPLSRLSTMLDRERAAAGGGGRAVFHIYDRDDVLLGTMEGVADGRIHGANQLAGETARAM